MSLNERTATQQTVKTYGCACNFSQTHPIWQHSLALNLCLWDLRSHQNCLKTGPRRFLWDSSLSPTYALVLRWCVHWESIDGLQVLRGQLVWRSQFNLCLHVRQVDLGGQGTRTIVALLGLLDEGVWTISTVTGTCVWNKTITMSTVPF